MTLHRFNIVVEAPAVRPNLAGALKAILRQHGCRCIDITAVRNAGDGDRDKAAVAAARNAPVANNRVREDA